MLDVSVQRQKERGPLLHDAHACVGMSVDAPLVTLGISEPTFQIEVVAQVQQLAPGKQTRLETIHHPTQVLVERLGILQESDLYLVELRPTLFRGTLLRIEGCLERTDVLDLPANLLLVFGDRGQASIDASGEPIKLAMCRPPF